LTLYSLGSNIKLSWKVIFHSIDNNELRAYWEVQKLPISTDWWNMVALLRYWKARKNFLAKVANIFIEVAAIRGKWKLFANVLVLLPNPEKINQSFRAVKHLEPISLLFLIP